MIKEENKLPALGYSTRFEGEPFYFDTLPSKNIEIKEVPASNRMVLPVFFHHKPNRVRLQIHFMNRSTVSARDSVTVYLFNDNPFITDTDL